MLEARGEAGSELALSHVGTPAKLGEALRAFTTLDVSEPLLKVSTDGVDDAGCIYPQRLASVLARPCRQPAFERRLSSDVPAGSSYASRQECQRHTAATWGALRTCIRPA